MIFFSLIFFLVAYTVAADEVIQLFCEGSDSFSRCIVARFEQTTCHNFGSLIGCNTSQQNCRGCETRDVIGRGIYKSTIDTWCQGKGGVIVTGSALRDCNS